MQIFTPFVVALERALNHALLLAGNRCWGEDSGRVLRLHSTHPDFSVTVSLTDQGIMLRDNPDLAVDAEVETSLFALLRALQHPDDRDALFSGDIRVTGDERLAFRVLNRVARLEIDWALWLEQRTGTLFAGAVERQIRDWQRQYQFWAETRRIERYDYWVHDQQWLPEKTMVDAWLDEVDTLRSKTERLEARINQLTHPSRG